MTESEEGARSAKKFAGIEIPPDLKWSNFFTMYLATFIMSCLMILPAVLQPAFLKEIIQIPEEQAGSLNAGLQSMSYVATLLFVGLVGIFSDKVGRRILAITGFVACGVFYIMFGWAKDISLALGITSVRGQIFITYVMRFLVGMSLITCYPQFIALVADYTDKRDRGKGMAQLSGQSQRFLAAPHSLIGISEAPQAAGRIGHGAGPDIGATKGYKRAMVLLRIVESNHRFKVG